MDSANTLNLNNSATLTFYGLTGWGPNNPAVLKNEVACNSPNCNITSWSSGAGTLVVSVAGFSNYSAQDGGGGAVPEFSDYAIILILVVTIGGFVVMKKKG